MTFCAEMADAGLLWRHFLTATMLTRAGQRCSEEILDEHHVRRRQKQHWVRQSLRETAYAALGKLHNQAGGSHGSSL